MDPIRSYQMLGEAKWMRLMIWATSIGHHINSPHFMYGPALSGAFMTPFYGSQPYGSKLAIDISRHVLIIFHGSTNDDGGPGYQWLIAEKTDALRTEIKQAGLELPGLAMGRHQGDRTFTIVPCTTSFFMPLGHFSFPTGDTIVCMGGGEIGGGRNRSTTRKH
jgi:hypothetical protein